MVTCLFLPATSPRLTCSHSYSSSPVNQVYPPQPHRFCLIVLPLLCKTFQHFSPGGFRAANPALLISIKLKLSSPFGLSETPCVLETLAALLCLLFCVRCVHIHLLASTFTSLSPACFPASVWYCNPCSSVLQIYLD